jgi:hypothetical protein
MGDKEVKKSKVHTLRRTRTLYCTGDNCDIRKQLLSLIENHGPSKITPLVKINLRNSIRNVDVDKFPTKVLHITFECLIWKSHRAPQR